MTALSTAPRAHYSFQHPSSNFSLEYNLVVRLGTSGQLFILKWTLDWLQGEDIQYIHSLDGSHQQVRRQSIQSLFLSLCTSLSLSLFSSLSLPFLSLFSPLFNWTAYWCLAENLATIEWTSLGSRAASNNCNCSLVCRVSPVIAAPAPTTCTVHNPSHRNAISRRRIRQIVAPSTFLSTVPLQAV